MEFRVSRINFSTKSLLLIVIALVMGSSCDIHSPDNAGNLVPRTVDEDASLSAVQINGTTLHLETFGDAGNPVLIFLHGGPGGDYGEFTRLVSLQDNYFLVFFDQRGSGLSRRHNPEDISIETYIEDLDEIIDTYRRSSTDRVNFFAHSWGAQVATFYIDDDPSRAMSKLDKVIFSDPGPFTGARFADMPIFDISLNAKWFNQYLWNYEFFTPDTHARADYVLILGSADSAPRYHYNDEDPTRMWRVGAVVNQRFIEIGTNDKGDFDWDWTQNLGKYTNTVHFIRSARNEIHTADYVETQRGDYPQTTLLTIDDVGHDGPWTKSAEYDAEIRNILEN
ncbi:MAG: alpha/beta hydrolase [Gammaproteobacteria bacterium]|nr:alpha/beta hydrolase [Gammaproteobacteria bacterium]